MSLLTNATGVTDLVDAANVFSGNVLLVFLSLAVFFVFFFILKRYDFDRALLASSFISFILSAFLAYGGFLGIMWPLIYLGIAAFTALYMWAESKQ